MVAVSLKKKKKEKKKKKKKIKKKKRKKEKSRSKYTNYKRQEITKLHEIKITSEIQLSDKQNNSKTNYVNNNSVISENARRAYMQ